MPTRPRSLSEFQKRFPNDAACAEFLFARRWPRGFVCPKCQDGRAALLKARAATYECQSCRRQTSVIAGTVMHRSKVPLHKWFWAAHLMAIHSNGISALQLAPQLGVTYKTAWLLAQKLRRAMVDPDRDLLSGVVEVDQTELPFRTKDSFFDPTKANKILIIGAVEVIDRGTGRPPPKKPGQRFPNTRAGRIRLAAIADNTAPVLQAFIHKNVAPGSMIMTDGHRSYGGLKGYIHDPRKVKKMAAHIVLPWIHRTFSLMKRWSLGTYHGLRLKHIDRYLEEFVFRFNRRRHRHISFEMVLGLAAHHPPIDYWTIAGKANPRKGQIFRRRRPRQRATAYGMRYDRT